MSTEEAIEKNMDMVSIEMADYKLNLHKYITMYYEFQLDKRKTYMRHR